MDTYEVIPLNDGDITIEVDGDDITIEIENPVISLVDIDPVFSAGVTNLAVALQYGVQSFFLDREPNIVNIWQLIGGVKKPVNASFQVVGKEIVIDSGDDYESVIISYL